jgi:excisionase family DNA binding protein
MEKLYTTQEVADILRVKINKVYEFIATGKLKAIKLGGDRDGEPEKSQRHWRVTETALNEFLGQK